MGQVVHVLSLPPHQLSLVHQVHHNTGPLTHVPVLHHGAPATIELKLEPPSPSPDARVQILVKQKQHKATNQ